MRYIFMIFGMSFCALGIAKEFLPKGCHAFPIENMVELKQQKNHLILIHSLSNYEIWLANQQQAKLTVSLVPGEWSAFYAPQGQVQWYCIQSQPGHEQKVSCQQVLAACDWSAKPPQKEIAKINSWVANNLSFSEMHAYVQRLGWRFKDKAKVS